MFPLACRSIGDASHSLRNTPVTEDLSQMMSMENQKIYFHNIFSILKVNNIELYGKVCHLDFCNTQGIQFLELNTNEASLSVNGAAPGGFPLIFGEAGLADGHLQVLF